MIRELSKPFIMVDSEGTVQNIAMFLNYEDANRITRAVYGENALATEYNYLVQAGDKYIENIYYNILDDGTEVPAEYIATQDDLIRELQNENRELILTLADSIGGVA